MTFRGTVIVHGIVERFLAYADAAPRSRTDFVERGPMKGKNHGKGVAADYVDYLTEVGSIRWVPGWRTKPRGPIPMLAVVVRSPPGGPGDLAALAASWFDT